ncbi:type IV pilus twitching motility protein PilT [Frigoribacterium sp. CG_9.8]|uniref:type IV pilus twitching motility protein PilT n=1 Tax=Frigoribacterium sp. CG_9.8 TaxID=2787733 RepID=UPI001A29A607|nr:type IV pilus twitching motility protein PilT [Frigoribacterium sp. CG_9.8]MBG6107941.1 twitching motility protein PilT [Frigoribacterium sp. CG_9.8]
MAKSQEILINNSASAMSARRSAPEVPAVPGDAALQPEASQPGRSPEAFDRTGAQQPRDVLQRADELRSRALDYPVNADPELIEALQNVLVLGASDLHITSNAAPTVRIDGTLRPIAGAEAWSAERVSLALMSILTTQQRETFERELELDLAYTVSFSTRFRVNLYQQRGAVAGAFRLIPSEVRPLSDLGIPSAVASFANLARGLVLITGPTGSGKSTTLAALVDLVNRTRADHIVTVEDPIEFIHMHQKSLVNQREVGSDTHSFANALKHVLRQDPDVILIGELRDLETISVALTAAETGHLVFATLHTQDASQTIDRVIDVFPSHQQGQIRAQLAATLNGVVCQTLVKRASGPGRAVATEVLMATPAIANLIREGKTYQIPSAMQAGRDLGMHTMDQHLAELVNTGVITRQAALDKAHDIGDITRLINSTGSPTEVPTRAMAASGINFGDSYSLGVHK